MIEKRKSRSLLRRLDDLVLAGANAVVKGWNCATGGTKADLAIGLFHSGSFLASIGSYGILAPPSLYYSYNMHKGFSELERKEAIAAENNLKDYVAEARKKLCAYMGYASLGLIPITIRLFPEQLFSQMIPIGIGLHSLSYQLMRADYLPPQKNVFSRLADSYRNYKDSKKLIPVPLRS
jgi:hypothetical protein